MASLLPCPHLETTSSPEKPCGLGSQLGLGSKPASAPLRLEQRSPQQPGSGQPALRGPRGPGGKARMRAAASPGDRLAPSPPAASGGCCEARGGGGRPRASGGLGQERRLATLADGSLSAGTATQPSLSKDSSSTDASGDEGGHTTPFVIFNSASPSLTSSGRSPRGLAPDRVSCRP